MQQEDNIPPYTWIDSFQSAIIARDVSQIRALLNIVPSSGTKEDMTLILLLSMDAEALVCKMREELVNKRNELTNYLSNIDSKHITVDT